MRPGFRFLLIAMCGLFSLPVVAQCPARPNFGTVVQDALDLYSQNGTLGAKFVMGTSVDAFGYTHYCYNYLTSSGYVEAPTLRLNPGDTLKLGVVDRIQSDGPTVHSNMHHMSAAPDSDICGDPGTPTLQSTNVHFHGLNVSPNCHQDDVISTLIQPGTPGFEYEIPIPVDEPPGLYWYHPHVHGFTEFQVNGGAAGTLIVQGIDKIKPEVANLTERVFTIRQQYLVPWIPGPYQLSINFQVAAFPHPLPIIQMKPGEKQFWRIANATIQDFLQLQFQVNGQPEPLTVVALDGYPLPQNISENTVLIPPAGRAEFIVQAPASGSTAAFVTTAYGTGPTGNPDIAQTLANIQFTSGDVKAQAGQTPKPAATAPPTVLPARKLKFADLANVTPNTQRRLYFSEEFGGTNGPIQFYITVDGQKQKVFEANEPPAITTKVGQVEDWTIENHALETHAFHMHQIHFLLLEVDGKPVTNQEYRDTIEVPFWEGPGTPYHSVKVRMDFRDPTIAGTFVFHCHILLHEDLGMMHKIKVEP